MILAPQGLPPDSVRATLEHIFGAPEYDWQPPPLDPFRALRELWFELFDWLHRLEQTHPGIYYVLLAALSALALAILFHFGYLVARALSPRPEREGPVLRADAVPRDAPWHRQQAERLEAEGRFAEALAHRFTALLLELDRREAVSFHPSKTPAEYIEEAHLDGDRRGVLVELVGSLYRHLFGGEPCTADDLRRFERQAALITAYGA